MDYGEGEVVGYWEKCHQGGGKAVIPSKKRKCYVWGRTKEVADPGVYLLGWNPGEKGQESRKAEVFSNSGTDEEARRRIDDRKRKKQQNGEEEKGRSA